MDIQELTKGTDVTLGNDTASVTFSKTERTKFHLKSDKHGCSTSARYFCKGKWHDLKSVTILAKYLHRDGLFDTFFDALKAHDVSLKFLMEEL